MLRGLLQRAGKCQYFVGTLSGCSFDSNETCAADGQRSGLVEEDSVRSCERFKGGSPLYENSAPRGTRHAGDEGDWCRQNERAWRRYNKHGEAANRVARKKPGRSGHDHGYWQQHQREAVGNTYEWRLGRLCSGDEAHNPGIRALAGGCRGRHLEGLPRV